VKKSKARFCGRGDWHCESIDSFDTLTPVVSWTTVDWYLFCLRPWICQPVKY
jgi:hypothetical protein